MAGRFFVAGKGFSRAGNGYFLAGHRFSGAGNCFQAVGNGYFRPEHCCQGAGKGFRELGNSYFPPRNSFQALEKRETGCGIGTECGRFLGLIQHLAFYRIISTICRFLVDGEKRILKMSGSCQIDFDLGLSAQKKHSPSLLRKGPSGTCF